MEWSFLQADAYPHTRSVLSQNLVIQMAVYILYSRHPNAIIKTVLGPNKGLPRYPLLITMRPLIILCDHISSKTRLIVIMNLTATLRIIRQPDVSRNALSFTAEFFLYFLFLPEHSAQQPCWGCPSNVYQRFGHMCSYYHWTQISFTPPLIFTGGQKVRFLALSLINARLWAAVVWKPSRYLHHFYTPCVAMTWQCSHQVWCR